MTKLKLYMRDNDVLYLEPNELARLASEVWPFSLREAFAVYKFVSDRYTLDHEHALKQGDNQHASN